MDGNSLSAEIAKKRDFPPLLPLKNTDFRLVDKENLFGLQVGRLRPVFQVITINSEHFCVMNQQHRVINIGLLMLFSPDSYTASYANPRNTLRHLRLGITEKVTSAETLHVLVHCTAQFSIIIQNLI